MLRYTLRVPNKKLVIFHWFPVTRAPKSDPSRTKILWVSDPPTAGLPTQERANPGAKTLPPLNAWAACYHWSTTAAGCSGEM